MEFNQFQQNGEMCLKMSDSNNAQPVKKRVRSKQKGSGFENVIAKKLSAALAPLKFIRTQGSGARVGGKNFATLGQMFGEEALKLFVGDVVPVNEKEAGVTWQHSLELKFYKTQDPFTSLVSGTANIYKWMEESVTDAVKINKTPLVVFKWNHTSIMVVSKVPTPCFTLAIIHNNQTLYISDFEELLTYKDFWVQNVS